MGKSQWISSQAAREYPGETGFSGPGRIEDAERGEGEGVGELASEPYG